MKNYNSIPKKHAVIVSELESSLIWSNERGDSLTLKTLIQTFECNGYIVSYKQAKFPLNYKNLNIKKDKYSQSQNYQIKIKENSFRWSLIYLYHVVFGFLSFLAPSIFFKNLKRILRNSEVVIVYYPWLVPAICRLTKLFRPKIILCEANIEVLYFKDQLMGKESAFSKILEFVIRRFEKKAISMADLIYAVSTRDLENIKRMFLPQKDKYKQLRILFSPLHSSRQRLTFYLPATCTRDEFIDVISGKKADLTGYNIMFIGSQYNINKLNVDKILAICSSLKESDNIKFLIVGNIYKDYQSEKVENPHTFFLGFIEDLHDLMKYVDAFIFYDFLSTGIEIKALTYQVYQKTTFYVTKDENNNEYDNLFGPLLIKCENDEEVLNYLRLASECKMMGLTFFKDHPNKAPRP